MAFLQKTWKDRVAEYINRRVLTKEDGTTELVSVERSEGTISQEGDAFSAANMNDLEQRIANEFSEQNKNLTASDNLKFQFATDGEGNYGYLGADDSFIPFKKGGAFESYLPSLYKAEYVLASSKTTFTNKLGVTSSSNGSRKAIANISGTGFTKISGGYDYAYHNVTFIKEDGSSETASFGRSIDIPKGTVYVIYAFLYNDSKTYTITFS